MADGHDHEFPARSVNGRCLSSARVAELYGDFSRDVQNSRFNLATKGRAR